MGPPSLFERWSQEAPVGEGEMNWGRWKPIIGALLRRSPLWAAAALSLGSPGDSVRWVILTKRSESWGSHPWAPISHWLRPAWGWGRSSLPLGRANRTLGVRGSPKAESQVACLEMVRAHRIWVGSSVSAEYIQWARFWRPVFLKDLNHRLYIWLIKFP